MRVSFDCGERLVASIDLVDDIFAGESFVRWGFTAEASDAVNAERVCLTGNATGTDTEVYACPEAAVQLTAGGLDVTEYTWAPSNAVSDPTLQHPTYTGVTGETLSVTYTNQCGVTVTDEVHVVVEEVTVACAAAQQVASTSKGSTLVPMTRRRDAAATRPSRLSCSCSRARLRPLSAATQHPITAYGEQPPREPVISPG